MKDNSENRYSKEEVIEEDGVTHLKSDKEPVNGVVYSEYEDGQLRAEEYWKDGERHLKTINP